MSAAVGNQKNRTYTETLEKLIGERKAWEQGAFRASNDALYKILAECLKYYNSLANVTSKHDRRKAFEKFALSIGITPNPNMTLLPQVVRVVFFDPERDDAKRPSRQRISAYTKVLSVAVSSEPPIQPADLPQWIESQGGVEEIRTDGKGGMKDAEKAEKAKALIEDSGHYLALVETKSVSATFTTDELDSAYVAVVVPRQNNKLEICRYVKSNGATTAVLAAAYADLKKEGKLSEKDMEQREAVEA